MAKRLDGSLGIEVGLVPGHIVLDGDPASHFPKGHSPQFSARDCCGQTAGLIKMPVGMKVGVGPGDIVVSISARVCCGEMAGLIKMPLDTEVGLGPGDIVLDGDPALLLKTGTSSLFGPCPLWPNSWVDQDSIWYGVMLQASAQTILCCIGTQLPQRGTP